MGNKNVLMKCGHTSNALKIGAGGEKIPCCVICGCTEISDKQVDLVGRQAKCAECGSVTKSNLSLSFFKYNSNSEYDSYYDGCHGWD